MAQNRYPAFPSRMALQQFKNRTKGAKLGHSLLKRKSDALKARVQQIIREIYDVKLQMNDVLKNAAFSYTQARHSAGDFNAQVISQVEAASTCLILRRENVVGVPIIKFEKSESSNNDESLMGLSRGGAQIRKCKESYQTALDLLVRLASLQTSFRELDDALKITNRRVNALANVVVPKLENTCMYITSELDEQEREDLYRLKKVVSTKRIQYEADEALRQQHNEALPQIAEVNIFDQVGQDDLVIDQL